MIASLKLKSKFLTKIPVSGSKGKGDVYVHAINTTGHWEYQTLMFHAADKGINLLAQ